MESFDFIEKEESWNLLSGFFRKNSLVDTVEVKEDKREYWMRDENVSECYDCKNLFTTFRRKHHCRLCGQIFCFKCSSVVDGGKLGYSGAEIRVCKWCMSVERSEQAMYVFFLLFL